MKKETFAVRMFCAGLFVGANLLGAGCGMMASQYDDLVTRYKQELCLAYQSKAKDEKTKSLERQAQLNKDYEAALASLSETEKAKLTLKWSMAQAQASQGNCD